MNIKMIVTDLDRTLLRYDKTISQYSVDVLNKCRDKGIKLVFATARPKRTVDHFCLDVPIDGLIFHNGAVVCVGENRLASFGINPESRDHILLAVSKDYPTATVSVEIDDVLYANFNDLPEYEVWQKKESNLIWNHIKTDFTDLPPKPADKIIIGVKSMEDIKELVKYVPDNFYIEMNSGDNINLGLIMNRFATKWNAVQTLSAHFGIVTADIVAFGDDYNDIGMLRGCGVGVSVANAIDEAKAAADFGCDTNDNDGVARWLEENLL